MEFRRPGLVALVLITACLPSVRAEVSLSKSFTITKPIGGRDFLNPQSVCGDRIRGDIYVADTGNGKIVVVTKDGYAAGGFIHRSDNEPDGSGEPLGVAVDSRGNTYVTDLQSSHIDVYDFRGRLKEKIEVPELADGGPPVFGRMAVDSKDNLYVVVRNKGVICVLDPKGTLKLRVGSKGKGKGRFEMLADVAVDASGKIYALDTLGIPVQVFSPEGKLLFVFGKHAAGRGNFAHPTALDVDPDGRIWVVDSFAQVVDVYDSQGRFLTDFGGFFFPIDLAYIPATNRLYVLEKNGGRLLGFDVK